MRALSWLGPRSCSRWGSCACGCSASQFASRFDWGRCCAPGSVRAGLAVAAGAVVELPRPPADARHFETTLGTWIPMGPMAATGTMTAIPWGFALDPLSAIMILVVTGVGFLIHVYSVSYMEHEE